MKKILMLLILTPFLMCSSCDTSEVGSNKQKKIATLKITCHVTLPTAAELPSSYSWIDEITLDNTEDLSGAYVYYADIDGTSDPVFKEDPWGANFVVDKKSLSEDKRSGTVEVVVISPELVSTNGKYFAVQLYNEANKKTIANHEEPIKYDKEIKKQTIITCDATLDFIYTNMDMDMPIGY